MLNNSESPCRKRTYEGYRGLGISFGTELQQQGIEGGQTRRPCCDHRCVRWHNWKRSCRYLEQAFLVLETKLRSLTLAPPAAILPHFLLFRSPGGHIENTLCKYLKASELLLSFLKRPAAKAEIVIQKLPTQGGRDPGGLGNKQHY